MKSSKWLLAGLYAISFSTCAADMFFVVGRVGWSDPHAPIVPTSESKMVNWAVGSQFTSIIGLECKEKCPEVAGSDGVVPAFANTWTSLSKKPVHFVVYRQPETALIARADERSWTDFKSAKGIYQDALAEIRKAQRLPALAGAGTIDKHYLIWTQNEADAPNGVSAKEYQARLVELFEHFNKDLVATGKPFDAMFIVGSGPVLESDSLTKNQAEKLNAIVQAQDSAAEHGKLVMISRSLRRAEGVCPEGIGRTG